MAKYFNISGELTQTLISSGESYNISKISLTNIQKVSKCKVDLYIEKKLTGKFYLLKEIELPIGTTLIYDDMNFSTDNDQFSLYIKLTDGATFTLTGSIDPIASTTVTGVGTSFLSEVSIGDEIVVTGETRTVSDIASDTSLTVSSAFSDNSNDTTPDCNPTALVDVIIN
tara:strand:+ start:101 stop:610 length:510 start_codon:yes stop_codon:yes gene_type:complete